VNIQINILQKLNSLKKTGSFHLIIFLILMLIIPNTVIAGEVRAFVDRNQITLGESLNLMISVKGEGGEADVSPIRDFKVISRGTSTSVQIVNSRITREMTYNYTLIPLKEGMLKIPPLTVTADGNTYKTEEIIVKISKTPQQDTRAGSRDVFAEAYISNPNPYQGEQILYTLKFCNGIQIENARFQKPPEFPGFTAKKIEQDKTYRSVIAGRQYNVNELNYILIPTDTGEKIIEPAMISCDIVIRQSQNRRTPFGSIFDDPFFSSNQLESKTFMTEAVMVNVKPFPPYSGDTKFSGLVGKFDIQAELEANSMNAGDSATLSVTIKGAGNIMDAGEPEVKFPESFKVYKDNPEEEIQLTGTGYQGKKVFRIAVVPAKEGDYSIPPIQLSYFNTETGNYETRSAQPISLTVNPPKEKENLDIVSAPLENGNLSLKKKVEFIGRDILPPKENPLESLKNHNTLSLMQFIGLLIFPPIFFLSIKTAMSLTRKNNDPSSIMAERANKALKDACKSDLSREEFLSCLYRSLISVILSKAGVKGESLTYAEAENILQSKGYSDEIAANAANLLEKIESAKFSGLNMNDEFKQHLLSETRQMVRSLS